MQPNVDGGSLRDLIASVTAGHAPAASRLGLRLFLIIDRNVPETPGFDAVRLSQALDTLISDALRSAHAGKVVVRARWFDASLQLSVADAETRIAVTPSLEAAEAAFHGDDPDIHAPVILCRASEYREWFDNLYDSSRSLTYIASADAASQAQACAYLVATDEFSERDIDEIRKSRARVIRVTQNGPLAPLRRADGTIELSVFALKAFRDAVRMVMTPIVLIAEDHPFNRRVLREQMTALNAFVLEASDGEEALDMLRKHRVDIVLTDMNMPKLNGEQLLARARELHPALRVFAISASASQADVERGRAIGFTDYLTKPVSFAVLSGVMRACAVEATVARHAEQEDDPAPRLPAVPPAYARDIVQQIDADIVTLDAIRRVRDAQTLRRWAHKVSGGLSVLGPSMLYDTCEELRAVLRESGAWIEDMDVFVDSIRAELIALRDQQRATLQT